MHKAQALVIHCIDLRVQSPIHEYLTAQGLTDKFDPISWPGASQDFETIMKGSAVSLRLHDHDVVYIIEHENCGAYGENDSVEAHTQNVQKLAAALKEIKPSLKIIPLILTSPEWHKRPLTC